MGGMPSVSGDHRGTEKTKNAAAQRTAWSAAPPITVIPWKYRLCRMLAC